MNAVERRHDEPVTDYAALYDFSLRRTEDFWRLMWEFGEIRGTMGERVVEHPDRMPGARFFPDATLNFAENMLRVRDDRPAIVFNGEGRRRSTLTYRELYDQVTSFATALRAEGIQQGDRVAGYLPNMPEAIVAALGAAAIGASWSSCSPDFGTQGVLDRFGQIAPRILVAADGYFYGGKRFDLASRIAEIRRGLPSILRTILVEYAGSSDASISDYVSWDQFLGRPPSTFRFDQLPFNHPLYILYSSGTTGVPKCIVHGAGGTLIQHLKEHQLQSDIQAGDRVFYFTTCGWMMWNWLVSALASEATLLLYDGSPFHPDGNVLFDYAAAERCTLFGTSAKYIDACAKAEVKPIDRHDLPHLRTICSTGSPLVPEGFDYIYDCVKKDVCLASFSGGTDIVSCFVIGVPISPVWRGEIQARGLGMAVDVLDDHGRP